MKPSKPAAEFADQIRSGKRRSLARAITLVESTRREDMAFAQDVLLHLMPYTGNSLRVGITGVPGVGKSTFIEALGNHVSQLGKKIAVLAVDPSSPYTGGSILGDKTRMQELSRLDEVFIRPSPTAGTLGGVSRKTRESILLCEAAGYDVIIVETVGVGQSEYEVASMVDFFLMLMLPNAGDSLQGIKRGIMELADLILVNKADGSYLKRADSAARDLKNALHLVRPKYKDYTTEVALCSALEQTGIDEAWQKLIAYTDRMKGDGLFAENRKLQLIHWTRRLTEELLLSDLWSRDEVGKVWDEQIQSIQKGETTPVNAGRLLIDVFKRSAGETVDRD